MENVSERRPAITEPINAVAQLFQDIAASLQNSRFGDLVGYALRFLSLTAVRPGEVNNSEWSEIDWDKARWTISAAKMKMDKDHVVPLSRQALEILKAVHELTGNRRYIFSCTHDQPLSNNTLNKRLRVIGYDTAAEHCAHGFRSACSPASTERLSLTLLSPRFVLKENVTPLPKCPPRRIWQRARLSPLR
jgi:integrase